MRVKCAARQVLEGTTVSMYRNLELLDSMPIPRPVTDCFNG